MSKVVWKAIKDFQDYEVSNTGLVRSLKYGKVRVLKPRDNGKGYLMVLLCLPGIQKNKKIHRLVGEAFIANSNKNLEINHKDGNKTNNDVLNLEWVTRLENIKHSLNTGLNPHSEVPIFCVELKQTFDSISQASKYLSIRNQHIKEVLDGKRKKTKDLTFRRIL